MKHLFIKDEFNPKHQKLRQLINDPQHFEATITLAMELHDLMHQQYQDLVLQGKEPPMKTKKMKTIAYNLWHITRIEDLCVNLFISGRALVFDALWAKRIKTPFSDIGNGWSQEEIRAFSTTISFEALLEYRKAVHDQTQAVLKVFSQMT
ncbi:MAG: hypothetical protein LBR37_01695 [Erysipelotrichaceae bacterium]|jgi:hypothetical protein|nr:hypothetical protein [Erysipelotrichaceae bacterium]